MAGSGPRAASLTQPRIAAGEAMRDPSEGLCGRRRMGARSPPPALEAQVLVLVVQNDAQPENIGVATSTATFFRSMGGSFGVAIFGAIFAARLSGQLAHFPRAVVDRLGSGVQLSPAEADRLPPAIHADFLDAFAHALHGVFLFGTVIAIIPFLLSWFLKEVPLRTTLARQPSVLGAEEAPGGGTPPEKLIEV